MSLNQRPSRAPSPSDYSAQSYHTADADREADDNRAVLEQRVSHATPAVRQPRQEHGNEVAPQGEAQPPLPKTDCTQLLGAIAAVMAEIQPVEKGGWNKFQSYAFARMQDLLVTVTPLMGKHGIVVFQHEEGREMFDGGNAIAIRYRFTIVHKSGEVWFERPLQTGLSRCRDSKQGFDDKSLNKCHTAARKYFLMSLFQIPTEDMEDGDDGERPQAGPRPQGKRRAVPGPDGKVGPHSIAIVDGEAPEAWAKRFNAFIDKAATEAEVNDWYDKNAAAFGKLQGRFQSVYDGLIDYMDARVAKLQGGDKPPAETKADPISSGKVPTGNQTGTTASDGFPGDTPIPVMLDRKLTADEQDWLKACDDAFAGAEDPDALAAEQDSVMHPARETVSDYAWDRAKEIVRKHLVRLTSG